MTFEIEGEYNTATVHTNKDKKDCEEDVLEQLEEMVNHEALEGDDDVAVMPDFHLAKGATIGFTMPVKDKIVPNVVSVDIGCGMYACNFGPVEVEDLKSLDEEIRSRVPMGFDVHDRNDYHMVDDFPWTTCEQKWDSFAQATDFDMNMDIVPKYPRDGCYFSDLCEKVEYDIGRAINSMGTLGGGNHFIELGYDDRQNLWCIIHSGSRGIGAAIAQYWQNRATDLTTKRQSIDDVPEDVQEYMGDNWKPLADKIRSDFEGEAIQRKFDEVSQAIQEYGPSTSNRNTDLDYLEGDEAIGYIKDMIFAQTYASESRKQMMESVERAIAEVKDATADKIGHIDSIESVHNYIDFDDATIRKGACRAHDGERLVVPFNMSYGTIIAEGKGQSDWNNSSAHGAGRAMSRTAAEDKFDENDFDDQIGDVYMSKQPLDEIPGAYKPADQIEEALGDSVDVITRVEPIMSLKAE